MSITKQGKFIIIEGGDFSGKSSLVQSLKQVFGDCTFTREPGSLLKTANANKCEMLRDLLLTTDLSNKGQAQCFALSRELHTKDIVELIKRGTNIICDRYVISSLVYQGYAGGLDSRVVNSYNMESLDLLFDNNIETHVITLQVSKENFLKRKKLREESEGLDVIEKKDDNFFKDVNRCFNKGIYKRLLPTICYGFQFHEIDANKDMDSVAKEGIEIVKNILK